MDIKTPRQMPLPLEGVISDVDPAIYIPLSIGGKKRGQYEAIVSAGDAELLKRRWHFVPGRWKNRGGYARAYWRLSDSEHPCYRIRGRTFAMHDLIYWRAHGIWPERDVSVIDHINGLGLDNRRENLRLATYQQNNYNRRLGKNATGFRGVYYTGQKTNPYRACIQAPWRRQISLGQYRTREEASAAYHIAAKMLHGKFKR